MERDDAAETKACNRVFKDRERARRDARMVATVKGGKLPFSSTVMSWLSRKLDKRSTRITPEDVKSLLT
jgi:hypothetical protein